MGTSDENKKGFLVFKRRKGEGFTINGNIELFVQKIGKNYAALMVRGPKGTKFLRTELDDGQFREESSKKNRNKKA